MLLKRVPLAGSPWRVPQVGFIPGVRFVLLVLKRRWELESMTWKKDNIYSGTPRERIAALMKWWGALSNALRRSMYRTCKWRRGFPGVSVSLRASWYMLFVMKIGSATEFPGPAYWRPV